MKKIHYVYLTTNLVNGKQYVGDHTIKSQGKYYLGSGTILKQAIKKYGEENFFKEILKWFTTREKAYKSQQIYIYKFNTLSPNGYNISIKGGYGHNKSKLAKETKEKIRKFQLGRIKSEQHCKNLSKSLTGKISPLKGKKLKPLSIKAKLNISKAQTGVRIGNKNPMFGKSFYDVWIIKYGKETANKKYAEWRQKRINRKPLSF